jgi:hypothetical protein
MVPVHVGRSKSRFQPPRSSLRVAATGNILFRPTLHGFRAVSVPYSKRVPSVLRDEAAPAPPLTLSPCTSSAGVVRLLCRAFIPSG